MTPDQLERATAISQLMLPHCISLFWHDASARWPRRIRGGSCCILHIADRLIGVTAAHVIEELQKDRSTTPGLVCQLGGAGYDPRPFVIGWDTALDIATFSVPPHVMASSGGRPIEIAPGAWPPPRPQDGEALALVGFPELSIKAEADFSAAFYAFGALAIADTVTDGEILVSYDSTRDIDLSGRGLPALGSKMSGCSGGPVLAVRAKGDSLILFPVGIIFRGPGGRASGASIGFDMIRARRIHMIRDDGTLDQAATGWLPG
jgi:hypothetical protein